MNSDQAISPADADGIAAWCYRVATSGPLQWAATTDKAAAVSAALDGEVYPLGLIAHVRPKGMKSDEDPWTDTQLADICGAVKDRCGPATAARLRRLIQHSQAPTPEADVVVWCAPTADGKPNFGKGWVFSPVRTEQATLALAIADQATAPAAGKIEADHDRARTLEVIALGESQDPVKDANDALVATGWWTHPAASPAPGAVPDRLAQAFKRGDYRVPDTLDEAIASAANIMIEDRIVIEHLQAKVARLSAAQAPAPVHESPARSSAKPKTPMTADGLAQALEAFERNDYRLTEAVERQMREDLANHRSQFPAVVEGAWVEVTPGLLASQADWLYQPMWIALKSGRVVQGVYEWRQGQQADRFIGPDVGDEWALSASHVMPIKRPAAPSFDVPAQGRES